MYRYHPRSIIKSHLSLAILMGLVATAFMLWTTLSQPASLQSATPSHETVSAETTESAPQISISRDRMGKKARGITVVVTSDITANAAFGQLFNFDRELSSSIGKAQQKAPVQALPYY